MKFKYRGFILAAAIASAVVATASAFAQDWPTRPVTLVGPFGAGGSTDLIARIVSEEMSKGLGQPIVVEARPGSSGIVGVSYAQRAKPDGYTLVMGTSGTHASNPTIIADLPYDPIKDFVPVSQFTIAEHVLAVHPSVPAENITQLIEYARANPGVLNYGSAGVASIQHIGGALLEQMAGVKMVHVPYSGSAPAIADLMAGNIDMVFGALAELMPQIQSGGLRAIAVTALKRSQLLPDVPTIAETLPGFELASWQGMFAPAGTPPEVIDRLAKEVARAFTVEEMRSKLVNQGLLPVGSSPDEFKAFLPQSIEQWRKMNRLAGANVIN
ncbi:Bug family tripartite tricarboxylate transporter substrate binding protein [Mesorhizobium sp. ASY16-5R]|uniref:Bug family tripartite tricarboxylate transporter substrate binding protein n=1 Tax=Mesorhizobium sp. ASY16-5R TaxID=3445772 RepID=UPI003FA16E4D